MEENTASFPGTWQLKLKNSFKRTSRYLLTACSVEEFRKAFPSFTAAQRESLHALFVKVISSSHADIQAEFESAFLNAEVGMILDKVEELVEEHNLDPLKSKKSNVGETAQSLTEAKKKEIKYLTGLIEKAENQNREIKARLQLLEKEKQDLSGAANLVDELKTTISNYESSYHTKLVDV